MTIDEAIKMLESILEDRKEYERGMGNNALLLGIEALKYYKEQRKKRGATKTMWLPGEDSELAPKEE